MQQCGRIRKKLNRGWTPLVDGEVKYLKTGALLLAKGDSYRLHTADREYSLVIVYGECEVLIEDGESGMLGPRKNPFEDLPSGVFLTKDESVVITAKQDSLIGIGSARAEKKIKNYIITADKVRSSKRGADNWTREVRFVCWPDNTEGNLLITGETVTPSGNWSTIPPHRHQYDIFDEEVPYDEVYFFQFSKPQGYGLSYQFDDEGLMDQTYSLRNNDSLYIGYGYHPTACGPGADLYHLTFMAGPKRKSQASIHKDFRFMLEQSSMANPFHKQ